MLRGIHLTSIGNDNMLLEPGDGLDPDAPAEYLTDLMHQMQTQNTRTLIYDMKSIMLIDAIYYSWLVKLHDLCILANVELILVNIRPAAAFALATSLKTSPPFRCSLNVESARQMNLGATHSRV